MISIPPKGSRRGGYCRTQSVHRVYEGRCGLLVLRCETPGDTTNISGGIHDDFTLNRVLLRMRAVPANGMGNLLFALK